MQVVNDVHARIVQEGNIIRGLISSRMRSALEKDGIPYDVIKPEGNAYSVVIRTQSTAAVRAAVNHCYL